MHTHMCMHVCQSITVLLKILNLEKTNSSRYKVHSSKFHEKEEFQIHKQIEKKKTNIFFDWF